MIRIDDRQLNRIIGLVYQAAFDSTAWPGAIETLRSSLSGSHVCITRVGPDLQAGDVITTQTDPYFTRLYLEDERFHASDLIPAYLQVPVGVVFRFEDLKGADHLYRSPDWNEWMLPQDIVATLLAKVVKEARSSWVLNVARGRNQPSWGDSDKAIFETLLSHIRSAIEIGRLRAIERASGTRMVGHSPGIVLVNPDLRIVSLDAAAETVLNRPGCPIRRKRQHLQVDPAQRETACGIDRESVTPDRPQSRLRWLHAPSC